MWLLLVKREQRCARLWDEQESPSCFCPDRLPLYHCSLGILSSRVIPTVCVCVCVCLAVSGLLLSVRQPANCCLMFLTLHSLQKQTAKHIFSHVHLWYSLLSVKGELPDFTQPCLFPIVGEHYDKNKAYLSQKLKHWHIFKVQSVYFRNVFFKNHLIIKIIATYCYFSVIGIIIPAV